MSNLHDLLSDRPRSVDDGACAHLTGMTLPHIRLPSTSGLEVDLGSLGKGRIVIYCYPRTGVPGARLPTGWNMIPGARGCTPQACAFRDQAAEMNALGARVFGLSTQTTAYQREMATRLHLPFEVLSDADQAFATVLCLPTFEVEGMRLIKRLTLIIHGGTIEHVFYPVFPPHENALEVVRWLSAAPATD